MENNNRLMPHIRRTTHIMMFAHRNCFDFHIFNARQSFDFWRTRLQVILKHPILQAFACEPVRSFILIQAHPRPGGLNSIQQKTHY